MAKKNQLYLSQDPPPDPMDYLVSQAANIDGEESVSSETESFLEASQLSTPQKKDKCPDVPAESSPAPLFASPHVQLLPGKDPLLLVEPAAVSDARKELFLDDTKHLTVSHKQAESISRSTSKSNMSMGDFKNPSMIKKSSAENCSTSTATLSMLAEVLTVSEEFDQPISDPTTVLQTSKPSYSSQAVTMSPVGVLQTSKPSYSSQAVTISPVGVLQTSKPSYSSQTVTMSPVGVLQTGKPSYSRQTVTMSLVGDGQKLNASSCVQSQCVSPTPVSSSPGAHTGSNITGSPCQSTGSSQISDSSSCVAMSQPSLRDQDIVIDLTLDDSSDEEENIACRPLRRASTIKSSPVWKSLIPVQRQKKLASQSTRQKVKEEMVSDHEGLSPSTPPRKVWTNLIPLQRIRRQSSRPSRREVREETASDWTTLRGISTLPRDQCPWCLSVMSLSSGSGRRRIRSKQPLINLSPITKFFKPVTSNHTEVKQEVMSPGKRDLREWSSSAKEHVAATEGCGAELTDLRPGCSYFKSDDTAGAQDEIICIDDEPTSEPSNFCGMNPLKDEVGRRSETFDSESPKACEFSESTLEMADVSTVDIDDKDCAISPIECENVETENDVDDDEDEEMDTVPDVGNFIDDGHHEAVASPDLYTDSETVLGETEDMELNTENVQDNEAMLTSDQNSFTVSHDDKSSEGCDRSTSVEERTGDQQRSSGFAESITKPGRSDGLRIQDADLYAALHVVKKTKVSRSEWCPLSSVCNQRQARDDDAVEMSSPLTQIMFSILDDEYVTVLKALHVQISIKTYPKPQLLSTLIQRVLLTDGEEIEVNLMYDVLMKMIHVHPPTSPAMQEFYREVISGIHGQTDRQIGEEWNNIRQCICWLLSERDDPIRRKGQLLLLRFFKQLLEQNLQYSFGCSSGDCHHDIVTKNMLVKMLWSPSYHIALNNRCQDMINLLQDGIKCYRTQGPSDWGTVKEVLKFIVWMVGMATECCRIQECRTSHGLDGLVAERTSMFVQSIASKFISADIEDITLLECLLTSLPLPWLRVGICQLVLNSLDDYLVTADLGRDTSGISLSLIVSRYMFLLPRFHVGVNARKSTLSVARTKPSRQGIMKDRPGKGLVENTDMNKGGSDKMLAKASKRNHKGETPLHTACIKNDINRLRQWLAVPGIDVNMKDNAGWTPLHEACNHGNVECVQELLKFVPSKTLEQCFYKDTVKCQKVDLLACNTDGITPLHDAVLNDQQEVCRLLLQHGGARLLTPVTKWKYTPLDLATTDEMVMLLTSFQPVKRKFSDSQDSLQGSQDSFSSLDETRLCLPSDHLYTEVIMGEDGSRIYCNTRSVQVYIYHVTQLMMSYITTRNIPAIRNIINTTYQSRAVSRKHSRKKVKLANEKPCQRPAMAARQDAADSEFSVCEVRKSGVTSSNSDHLPDCDEISIPSTTMKCSSRTCQSSECNSLHSVDVIPSIGTSHSSCTDNADRDLLLDGEGKENSYTDWDPSNTREDVEELKQDFRVIRNFSSHLNLFRSHVFKVCNPEDKSVIESGLLELSLLTSCLE